MSWVYRFNNNPYEWYKDIPYEVGYYAPNLEFIVQASRGRFRTMEEAEEKVHYLNGGCTKECRE